jgi:hypothetical protein
MRTAAVVLLAVVAMVACADKKTRLDTASDFSAAKLGAPSPSLLRYLSPEEKDALDRVDDRMVEDPSDLSTGEAALHPGDEGYGEDDGLGVEADGEETLSQKTAKASVSLLTVGITLGALVAPLFLY